MTSLPQPSGQGSARPKPPELWRAPLGRQGCDSCPRPQIQRRPDLLHVRWPERVRLADLRVCDRGEQICTIIPGLPVGLVPAYVRMVKTRVGVAVVQVRVLLPVADKVVPRSCCGLGSPWGTQPTAGSACHRVVPSPFADGLGRCATLIDVTAAGGELALPWLPGAACHAGGERWRRWVGAVTGEVAAACPGRGWRRDGGLVRPGDGGVRGGAGGGAAGGSLKEAATSASNSSRSHCASAQISSANAVSASRVARSMPITLRNLR